MTFIRFLLLLLPFGVWTNLVQAEDIISTVAGTGVAGYDGEGVATSKMLNLPEGVAVDSAGNLYIADDQNHRIRKVDSAGNMTTVAGTGTGGYDGEGIAINKMLNLPRDVAVDSAGNLYIADSMNYRIRKVDNLGNMTTVAGTGTAGYDGEGIATSKMLNGPTGVAVDSAGNLYIADYANNRIRKVVFNADPDPSTPPSDPSTPIPDPSTPLVKDKSTVIPLAFTVAINVNSFSTSIPTSP